MNPTYEDTFVEELITQRPTPLAVLLKLVIVLAAVFLALVVWLNIPAIFPVVLAAICFGAYYLLKLQNVEYEYAFTNGDFDVDKILGKRKRKRVVETNCQHIQLMAPYEAAYESDVKGFTVSSKLDASPSARASGRWFLIYEKNDGTNAFFVFQPSPRLRKAMKSYLRAKQKGDEAS